MIPKLVVNMSLALLAIFLVATAVVVGLRTVPLTLAARHAVCSPADAARVALGWSGGGRLLSVRFDSGSRGYWVRIRDRSGVLRDFFVERSSC